MDFSLTPEQELIRDSAREFCEREIVPHSRDWDRAEELDPGLVPKLAAAGYLGATIAEEYGGMGLDTVSYCLLMGGARAHGLFGARDRVGEPRPRREDDRKVGNRAAAARVAPAAGIRKRARVLRAHRAGLGIRSGQPRDPRGARRRRLAALRLEALHHARQLGRPRTRVCAQRRRRPPRAYLLSRPDRLGGIFGLADQGQAGAAGA